MRSGLRGVGDLNFSLAARTTKTLKRVGSMRRRVDDGWGLLNHGLWPLRTDASKSVDHALRLEFVPAAYRASASAVTVLERLSMGRGVKVHTPKDDPLLCRGKSISSRETKHTRSPLQALTRAMVQRERGKQRKKKTNAVKAKSKKGKWQTDRKRGGPDAATVSRKRRRDYWCSPKLAGSGPNSLQPVGQPREPVGASARSEETRQQQLGQTTPEHGRHTHIKCTGQGQAEGV